MDEAMLNPKIAFDLKNERVSADEMDEKRHEEVAYEYLCRLEEAKLWIESCIKEQLPPTTELEENLRNGVYLAKLGNFFCPKKVPMKKIFDSTQINFKSKGLHFRHTDNINYWILALNEVGLPKLIIPEVTDIYEKKNIPKAIYCLHALSLYLHINGKAPRIQDLYGKVKFTEEEISAMSSELKKYGINLPAFDTIGGIVAEEIPGEEAATHASIIAINEAIDNGVDDHILNALLNPCAALGSVDRSNIKYYKENLTVLKNLKFSRNENNLIHDAYDELLTKEEIQQCVSEVNFNEAFALIKLSIDDNNCSMLTKALCHPCLIFKDVIFQNANFYLEEFRKLLCDQENNNKLSVDKVSFQNHINLANHKADELVKKNNIVERVNDAMLNRKEDDFLNCVKSSDVLLSLIKPAGSNLYFTEMVALQENLKRNLTFEEIEVSIRASSTLIFLNCCVDVGDSEATYEALLEKDLQICGVDFECKHNYLTALMEFKRQKNDEEISWLTGEEVQNCVIFVNSLAVEENQRIYAIQRVNEALWHGDSYAILRELQQPELKLNLYKNNVELYSYFLRSDLQRKLKESKDKDDVLWLDEIKAAVESSNELTERALKCCKILTSIYSSVVLNDFSLFKKLISDSGIFATVLDSCFENYYGKLKELINSKTKWTILYSEIDEFSYFYVLSEEFGSWLSSDCAMDSITDCLSKKIIQDIFLKVNNEYDQKMHINALEPLIVHFQSHFRGKLFRNLFYQRLSYLHSQERSALIIQAWWRGCRLRKIHLERFNYWKNNITSIIKVQSVVRMHLTRSYYISRLKYFREHLDSVIKIQTCWRANKTRKAFKELMVSDRPSFLTVKMFLHLLEIKNTDFSEEMSCHHLQNEIVKTIRENQRLEHDLSTMDTKIGLLVKNRISLQEVVAHGKKLSKNTKEEMEDLTTSSQYSLKDSQIKIKAYESLFYLLQSEPKYLSQLIFLMFPIKESKFIETIVLSIFNYASNQREEYLLLKLFRTALGEEIRLKVSNLNDVVVGNPLIIKMIIGFHRNKSGQSALRDMLGPLVKRVLEDQDLQINTNPIDVYKMWINRLESQTGQPCGMEYNVEQDEALKHEEVSKQLQSSVEKLKEITSLFLNAIINSLDKIPYGMLYMAKVVKLCLEEKFQDAQENDILKVIGNLLYYRYINPAIVSPDAFGIVDVGGGINLTLEQRRNLGSIAKLLQFSASKIGFGTESPHLTCLNPFLIDCHKKFKEFFRAACVVEDLESRFKINDYTESLMLTKPSIYISLQEIHELHKLIVENEFSIAPDQNDALHEILEDLADVSESKILIGKTDLCLHLSNKFITQDDRKFEFNQIYAMTKQMIVNVIRCAETNSLSNMLAMKVNDNMKEKFNNLQMVHQKLLANEQNEMLNEISPIDNLSLEETIETISRNLKLLEQERYITLEDDFQQIVNTIALDIRNRHLYRKRRRQDIAHMTTTLSNLKLKTKFFEEQVDYYNLYIQQCLKNLGPEKNKKSKKKLRTFNTLKYTGLKLHEKGILKALDGLTKNQYKNVLFEISPTENDGSFAVKVKFMGTNMADVKLEIQSLLECQYEGVSVMKLFDRAQVNVNLLLYLINTKFYGKVK